MNKRKKIIGSNNEATKVEVPKVMNGKSKEKKFLEDPRNAKFIKIGDTESFGTHGFSKKMNIVDDRTIFDVEPRDVDVRFPVKILSFLSLEFDVNKNIKRKLIKAYKCISDVKINDSIMYAVCDVIAKPKNKTEGYLSNSQRTLDEIVSIDNIPEEIRHLTTSIDDPIRLRGEKVYVELNTHTVISNFILKPMQEIGTEDLLKISEISKVKYLKNKLYFALTFAEENEGTIFLNSANIIAANISLSHTLYTSLANQALQNLREGASIKFVRTSDLVNVQTKDLIFARTGMPMVRNPIIKLNDLSDDKMEEIKTKGGKVTSMFMPRENQAYLTMLGQSTKVEVNDETVQMVYGELINDEPTYYRDPKCDDTIYLCPCIKKLSLYTLFENMSAPFAVGVVSDTTNIAIAIEAIK